MVQVGISQCMAVAKDDTESHTLVYNIRHPLVLGRISDLLLLRQCCCVPSSSDMSSDCNPKSDNMVKSLCHTSMKE